MKVTWHANDLTKQSRLSASPGEYDGFPILSDLTINWVSYNHSIDARVAAAGALVFQGSLSGQYDVPSAIMPQLANAISALSPSAGIVVHPVVYAPNKVEQGIIEIALNPGGQYVIDSSFEDFDIPRVIDLQIIDSAKLAGTSLEPLNNVLRVPSNAWLHIALNQEAHGFANDSIRAFVPFIAVALLMAHDLDGGSIRLPVAVPENNDFFRVAELLRVVGIILVNGK